MGKLSIKSKKDGEIGLYSVCVCLCVCVSVVVCAGEFVGVAGGVHIPKRPDSRIGISLVPFRRT